jgi:hypothetical protein
MRQHEPILGTVNMRMNFKQLYISHVWSTNLVRGLVQGMTGVVDPPARGYLEGHLIGCWEGVGNKYLSMLETTIFLKPLDQGKRGWILVTVQVREGARKRFLVGLGQRLVMPLASKVKRSITHILGPQLWSPKNKVINNTLYFVVFDLCC